MLIELHKEAGKIEITWKDENQIYQSQEMHEDQFIESAGFFIYSLIKDNGSTEGK